MGLGSPLGSMGSPLGSMGSLIGVYRVPHSNLWGGGGSPLGISLPPMLTPKPTPSASGAETPNPEPPPAPLTLWGRVEEAAKNFSDRLWGSDVGQAVQ